MSSRAVKILALAISKNKQAAEKIVQEENYNINFDDELANASCLETINFFPEIDEYFLDNIPIVFQLAHNVERVYIGNLNLDTNLSKNRENGIAFTENSTTIDIENCVKSENGNEYVENIIMIGTNKYSAANGIGNRGDDESRGERVENENQMSNAEDTAKDCGDDEDKNIDETVKN
ncbi:hypothetical protein HHI36_000440 [Cryptolaemus montrouzieri]|uniref:Uncharacterized protein n=1 Tax=Cryptolaemus montrouzieri TaxID=559131 RepID=A0ABD2P4M7_9CUCU